MRGSNYVYEVAYNLQEDLKDLSDKVGNKETENLAQKIVGALEALEWHAGRYEGRKREMTKLEEVVDKLEKEKLNRLKDREIQEQDRTKIEELWHMESLEQMHLLEKLEEDNSALKEQIDKAVKLIELSAGFQGRVQRAVARSSMDAVGQPEIRQVHLRLKETIDGQSGEIRHIKKELAQRCVDFDAMQQQCISLSNTNADICERLCNSKLRSKRLIEEKAGIEARLLLQQKCTEPIFFEDDVFLEGCDLMMSPLGPGLKQPETDKETEQYEPQFSWEEVCGLWKERDRLRSEVEEKEGRLRGPESETCATPLSAGDVQGPINREPDDKLEHLQKTGTTSATETGISRFFQKILRTPRD